MHKRTYIAFSVAALSLLASFTLWTTVIDAIRIPHLPRAFSKPVERVVSRLKSAWHGRSTAIAVNEVKVESLAKHFSQRTLHAHLESSVASSASFNDDALMTIADLLLNVPHTEKKPSPPRNVALKPAKKSPVMAAAVTEPVPVKEGEEVPDADGARETVAEEAPDLYAAAPELEKWELTRAWDISIPSLGVRAPVLLPSMRYWKGRAWDLLEEQMQVALNHGAVAYPHSSAPGESGSLIVAGHSSPPTKEAEQSMYGHLFASLPNLTIGETISVLKGGTPITYEVQEKVVVPPHMTSILEQQSDESVLKLITCYPVGTTRDRMIVVAKKVEGE